MGKSGCKRLCYAAVSHRTNRYRHFRESLAFCTHASHWDLWPEQWLKRERESTRETDPFCSIFPPLSGSTLFIFRSEQMHFGADRFGEDMKIHSIFLLREAYMYWWRLNAVKTATFAIYFQVSKSHLGLVVCQPKLVAFWRFSFPCLPVVLLTFWKPLSSKLTILWKSHLAPIVGQGAHLTQHPFNELNLIRPSSNE